MFLVVTVVGLLIGGLLVEYVSWCWVFYVNLLFGVVVFVALVVKFFVVFVHGGVPLDVIGVVLLVGAMIVFMFFCLDFGIVLVVLMVLLVVGFVARECCV